MFHGDSLEPRAQDGLRIINTLSWKLSKSLGLQARPPGGSASSRVPWQPGPQSHALISWASKIRLE